jgi:N-methylhydantoinase B
MDDAKTSPRSGCDAVTLEIVKGALRAALAEMEALIERTAMSNVIREKKDFFAGYFDPEGRLVIGTPLPVFGHIIGPILERYPAGTMRPGDLYWYNDVYGSGGGVTHSNDQVFASPVFVDGKLSGFSQGWAHFTDIGGSAPGSMSPNATDHFQEGLIVPPTRLYREGVLNEEVFRIFVRNSRFPMLLRGDTRALTASVRLGERRLLELFARFGREVVLDAFARLNDQTAAVMRRKMTATFPPGRYEFADVVETDGQGNGPFTIRLAIEASGNGIVFDGGATDDQSPGPINWLMHPAVPRMIYGLYLAGDVPELMVNEGMMRAIDDVRLREGSLLQPRFPAAVGHRGLALVRVMNMCVGLAGVATGGRSNAGGNSYALWWLRGADPATGETIFMGDGIGTGYGARPYADGHDAVYFIAQESNPAEFLDQLYPMRLLRYEIRRDTGGPGRWRGGCGVVRELEWLGPDVILANRLDSTNSPPWGVNGGKCGAVGRIVFNPGRPDERELPPIAEGQVVRKGDVLRMETGGGGGWGHPHDREAERVLADVRGGFVSPEAARAEYGVALSADGRAVDEAATRTLRARRYPARLFHRGEYRDAMT